MKTKSITLPLPKALEVARRLLERGAVVVIEPIGMQDTPTDDQCVLHVRPDDAWLLSGYPPTSDYGFAALPTSGWVDDVCRM